MNTQTPTLINGVNVDQLVATVNAIKQNPDLARFQFRAHNEWLEGGHSRTFIQGFYGAGQEDASRTKPFVLEGDEPPVLLSANAGQTLHASTDHTQILPVGLRVRAFISAEHPLIIFSE